MKTQTKNQQATLIDVARHAGVAVSTASAALNRAGGKYTVSDAKREAVLNAAKQLNYEVNPHAKRLVTGRDSSTVGLFCLDFVSGVSTLKLRYIQYLLIQAGFNVPIYSSGGIDLQGPQEHADLLASLRLQQPRAIVSASVASELLPEFRRFQDSGGLLVTYDQPTSFECDQVVFDREQNTYDAARHLLELGHRRIGLFIEGPAPVKGRDRYLGFTQALNEFGGETRDEWLVHSGTLYTKTLGEGGGELLAQTFLKWQERPTAMCIVNDSAAAAFIATVQRAGVRVPEDVSVCGTDDLPIAGVFTTRITTVSQPVEEIASKTAELLLSRLQDEYDGPPRCINVHGKLIVRESTAAI